MQPKPSPHATQPSGALHTDLILFEPMRNVVYGMPVFVSDDSKLLRHLMLNHGEWSDNPCQWLTSPRGSPLQIVLYCAFNSKGGQRQVHRLMPHLDAAWRMVPPEQRAYPYSLGAAGLAKRSFDTVWYAHRNAPIRHINVAPDTHLARQQGYWFPCDGAIAMDISAWPENSVVQPARLIEQMVRHAPLIEVIRARAECCFLLHLLPRQAGHVEESTWASVHWCRERPLPGRQGHLIEACVDVPIETTLEVSA